MAHLTLWQKLNFIEDLMIQIVELELKIKELENIIEDTKHQKKQDLVEFEIKIKKELKEQKKRESFLKELLTSQNQEKDAYNQIIVQINSAIDNRLSNPEEYSKLNIDPNNPKEIELIKKALRQKLLAKI
jgi:arginyl-tRNA synthetase